jgi:hypothetical protein
MDGGHGIAARWKLRLGTAVTLTMPGWAGIRDKVVPAHPSALENLTAPGLAETLGTCV